MLCDGVAHAHYDTLRSHKPDSRPDGIPRSGITFIRLQGSQCKKKLKMEPADSAWTPPEKEDAPQTVSPSEILPAASRCSSLSVVPCRISTRH